MDSLDSEVESISDSESIEPKSKPGFFDFLFGCCKGPTGAAKAEVAECGRGPSEVAS